jgi:ATP-dependent DNA helicase DinG
MQGALPKMELITRHKQAIDNGAQSVIFGLGSMSVGIDLPGEYCTHVIVAKLPFATFDSPLEEAKREWIENQGRSAFEELSLPEAGVKLAQAAGRLLRTVNDYGTVTILDKRLISAKWGERLLASLPPFPLSLESWRRPPAGKKPDLKADI